ncbi:MAG: aspartate carbamoyltransferase catalytic subunit [Planctomycetota bacterium]|nr:aspartate carbamoyltransferase catalytic subunit [Planctomycetota bacterium]
MQEVIWTKPHLLGIQDLSGEEILHILDLAASFKEVSTRSVKKVPALRGRVVVNLFFEASTRTSNSFALAAKRLSADTMSFTSSGSSVSKGETLIDTARNIEAMGVDAFVVRHSAAGAPHLLSKHLKCSVINAGDGCHEHPTQGLLDIFTIRETMGRIEGLRVAILGDIRHSRVARSNAWGLTKLGARVVFCGPPSLIPRDIREYMDVEISHDVDEVVETCDVLNCLRIQFERKAGNYFPSVREYAAIFGLNGERMKRARPGCIIMHPGPINRGIELTPELADGPRSVILRQVENGLAVRMAVLYLCVGALRGHAGAENRDEG